jgi:hypothetical protein
LAGYGIPVELFGSAHWIGVRTLPGERQVKHFSEVIDSRCCEKTSIPDYFIGRRLRVVGSDDTAVCGHRLRIRKSEALSGTWGAEDLRGAHMPEDIFVVIEEAEELNAVGVGQCCRVFVEAVGLRTVTDDPKCHIVVGGDCIEGVQEEVDVLVFDQATGKQDVIPRLREWRVLDLVDVDTVRDDFDGLSGRADFGQSVGCDR